MESGQWNLDDGIGDKYILKSIANVSEENPIYDLKANTSDQKITFFTFVEANINSSYMHGNDHTIFLEALEIDQRTVPEYNENTHHMTSRVCYNKEIISVNYEQGDGVISEDDFKDIITDKNEQDDGVVSGDDVNDTSTDNNKHDDSVVSGDDVNDKFADDHEQDDRVVSKDYGNDKITEDQEHDDGVVLGDDDNETVAEDDDNETVAEDDDNETVAEDFDSVNTFFVTDEDDMGIKNLFSCIRKRAKIKDTTSYRTLTNGKEKKPPIDPFRQTQSKLIARTNKHVFFSHPPSRTIRACGVHNSGIIGASIDTSMQSGKTYSGNIQTGNVHFENLGGRDYIVNNRHVANIGTDSDQYDFSHPKRGYAVLIVNQNFSRLDARDGAEVDVENTTMVLERLGFIIKNEKVFNLDKQSALTVLRDAKYADHSKMDSFAFIISSHGNEIANPRNGKKEHAVYFSDDRYIFTNDILEMFSDENCPSLKGKPKLFFIQACRGTNTDSGVEIITVDGRKQNHIGVHNRPHHGGKNLERLPHDSRMNAESNPHLCRAQMVDDMDAKGFEDISDERPLEYCNNDCLVMYAIPSGYFAWRSNMDGSWMLHYLWEEVKNYNFRKPCSFLKILTAVNRKMSNRETNVPLNIEKSGKKAIPVIIHQLDKDIVFQEKKPQDYGFTMAYAI
ncbi:hypothetical protein ACJMK2_033295 [Sinanodonta woodiana]|uniref:Uncharacterized protein n=1 Tax=Sinanodonta woodiana TaxID=1069815 RepID=A0ABD3WNE0_SINWO